MTDAQQSLFLEGAEMEKRAGGETEPFDWWTNDDGDTVVESQMAIAIYRNRRGHVVIRGERQVEGEEDSFVYISTAAALKAVIDRLQRELREGF
jgi:hypothetical protein